LTEISSMGFDLFVIYLQDDWNVNEVLGTTAAVSRRANSGTNRESTMKKFALILFLLALGLLAYQQRGAIALRIAPVAIEAAMSGDRLEELGDGMHLVLCGAGGPMPDPRRTSACVAVIAENELFVVDAGTGGVRNLARMRLPLGNISAVFLTHFHSDHIDGLGEMAMMRWVSGANAEPLAVYGPGGVAAIVEGFNKSYAADARYRNAHHGDEVAPLSGTGMTPIEFQSPVDGQSLVVYEKGDLRVETITVDHYPVKPAVAYLFHYRGRSILVSGDTVKSKNIEKHAAGIDLLVHEALAPNLVNVMNAVARNVGDQGMEKITHDILDYHATPVQAAETARDAGVGHLLYYHIVPPLILPGAEAAWLEGVDAVFTDYTVGQDGTTFTLPPESDEIIKVESSL
jgi:ribonuclease Z